MATTRTATNRAVAWFRQLFEGKEEQEPVEQEQPAPSFVTQKVVDLYDALDAICGENSYSIDIAWWRWGWRGEGSERTEPKLSVWVDEVKNHFPLTDGDFNLLLANIKAKLQERRSERGDDA